MTPKQRERMIETARQYQIGTYANKFVAPEFQRMIRAEAGAKPEGSVSAVVDGIMEAVYRSRGECVCVTCGLVLPWSSGIGGMHTGHFLGSRCFSILFEEQNVAPQCSGCNRYHSGRPQQFRLWMNHVRGTEVVERLEALKGNTRHMSREEVVNMRTEDVVDMILKRKAVKRTFTRGELVDMRIDYKARLKAAELLMVGNR